MTEKSKPGLSILPNGLIYEYIDESESDFLYDEIFIRNSYRINTKPRKVKKRKISETPNGLLNDIFINLQNNSVIIDVGANIGIFSLFCQLQSKNIKVFAIEPLPPIVDVLERNLGNFSRSELGRQSESTFHVIPCGITNNSIIGTTDTFYYFHSNPAESTRHISEWTKQKEALLTYMENNPQSMNEIETEDITTESNNSQTNDTISSVQDVDLKILQPDICNNFICYECPVCSLEYLFDQHKLTSIDILKIDAEGDELNVLLSIGAESSWDRVKQIVVGKFYHLPLLFNSFYYYCTNIILIMVNLFFCTIYIYLFRSTRYSRAAESNKRITSK